MLGTCDGAGLAVLAGPGPRHRHRHRHGGWGWGGPSYGWPYAYASPYLLVDDIDRWVAQPAVIEEERRKCLAEKHTWDAAKSRCIG
jgi:hypothetical protein